MFPKPSLLFTMILGVAFMLLSLPLSTYALPTPAPVPVPAPMAAPAPAPVALPAAMPHNPTSLLGRTFAKNHARAAAPDALAGTGTPSVVLRAADEMPIKRAERFQLRMERARRLAQPGEETA